jgi:UDP-N-acetylglucosamine 3-dehydrogenase
MLKVGVIGTGSMGRHHVRVMSELAHCEMVGLADPDESKRELAEKLQTAYFADYRELLAKEPQLVSIAAPTSTHYELALAALDAGCHLLIEKPVCNDLGQARELITRAAKLGLSIAVGHIERFNPAVVALKRLIDQRELGEVLTITNLRVGPYHGRILDTGIILDLGVHDVDLISMLSSSRISRVFAMALKRQHNHEDHAVLSLELEGGRSGIVELSWNAPYRMRNVLVSGTKRYALCDLMQQRLLVYEEQDEDGRLLPQPQHVEQGEPLKREIESVVQSVLDGTPPQCNAEDSVHALEVCLAALRSTTSRQAEAIEA